MDVPDTYGVMFIIRLQHGPYTGPPLSKTSQFNGRSESPAELARQNRQQDSYLRLQGCFRTTAMQEFHKSDTVMLVEIIFGEHADKHMNVNGMVLMNVSPYYQPIIKGAIIVGAVLLDQVGRRRPV